MRLEVDFRTQTATVFADEATVLWHFSATSSQWAATVDVDELVHGAPAGSLAAPGVRQPRPRTEPDDDAGEPDVFDVAGHTVNEVLEYVGDDQARARYAHEVEQARGTDGRTSLLAALDRVLDRGDADGDPDA